MYNFPLIARIHGLQRETAASPAAKNLYASDNNLVDDFTSTWIVGAEVKYTANNTLWNVNGDYHSTDEYIYRLVGGVITKVGRSLFNTSFGYATYVFTDCAQTTQEYIFYSYTYSKWRPNRWDEDADWFDGMFLQNNDEVTYSNGTVTSSARYCNYQYPAFNSCYAANANGTPDAYVYTDSNTPINSWTNGTYIYGDYSLATPTYSAAFYVNISGTPTYVTSYNYTIESISPCSLGYSFGYYETPFRALSPGSYPVYGYLWSPDAILQVSTYVYTDNTFMTAAPNGFYYTTTEVIEVSNGAIISINTAFSYYQGFTDCNAMTPVSVYAFDLNNGRTLYNSIDNANPGDWNKYTGYSSFMYSGNIYWVESMNYTIYSSNPCST